MRRRRKITSSPCVGACGRFVFRRRPSRIAAWLSGSFSTPPKRERSTYRLIFTHRSKRESSHFFAKRESRQTKLRLQVSSLDAAGPRRARNPRCFSIWYRRWTGRKAVARQNRDDRAREMGTPSRLFDREFVVGGSRFPFVAKRPISERVLFFRSAHRIAPIGRIRKTPGEDGERPLTG